MHFDLHPNSWHEPEDTMRSRECLRRLHQHSSHNRSEIEASERCGCFYCEQIFAPSSVRDWYENEVETTAACPRCGIDSVIGDAAASMRPSLLIEMHAYWFGFYE